MARNFQIAAFVVMAVFILTIPIACAQDAPASPINTGPLTNTGSLTNNIDALKRQADDRAAEWNQSATTLEQRIARMLPCDEHVLAAIDEVSRASEARLSASTNYWRARVAKSKEDAAALALFLTEEQARTADWTRDHSDAEQERTSVDAHVIALKASAARAQSLAEAEKLMEAIAASTAQMTERAGQREVSAATFADELRQSSREIELVKTANESKLEALLSMEIPAWREYYAARTARARTECSITNSDAPAQRRNAPHAVQSKPPISPKPTEGGN